MIGADGTGLRGLAGRHAAHSRVPAPAFSPDGTQLIYQRDTGNSQCSSCRPGLWGEVALADRRRPAVSPPTAGAWPTPRRTGATATTRWSPSPRSPAPTRRPSRMTTNARKQLHRRHHLARGLTDPPPRLTVPTGAAASDRWDFAGLMESQTHAKRSQADGIAPATLGVEHRDLQDFHDPPRPRLASRKSWVSPVRVRVSPSKDFLEMAHFLSRVSQTT